MLKSLIRSLLLAAACSGLGTSGCAHNPGTAANADGGMTLVAQVLKVEPQSRNAMPDGSELHTGELIAVQARVSAPAYIYVIQYAGGKPEPLFDNQSQQTLSPDRRLRLPAQRDGFPLEGAAGNEELLVIASQKPLNIAAHELCVQYRLPCASLPTAEVAARKLDLSELGEPVNAEPPPKPPRCPNAIKCREGEKPQQQDASFNISKFADQRGVAIITFHFKHLP